MYPISAKIRSSITVFNIKNKKKCFLSSKILFLKDHVDSEDWSSDADNSALHHMNKLHFNIYSNSKQLF